MARHSVARASQRGARPEWRATGAPARLCWRAESGGRATLRAWSRVARFSLVARGRAASATRERDPVVVWRAYGAR